MGIYRSYTQISTLFRCGRMYQKRYIERKPSILNASLLAGRVYHQTVAAAYNKKLAGYEMGNEEVADIFSGFWERSIADKHIIAEEGEPKTEITYVEWRGRAPGELKDKGIRMCKHYLKEVMPGYKPLEVEQKKETEINGIILVGYLDAVAENAFRRRIIIDHKWRKKSFSDDDLNNDFQSTFYTILSGIPYTQFHTALDQTHIRVKIDEVQRVEDDIAWVKQLIKEAHQQIQAGSFPPNGISTWVCSIDYCSYYTECRMGWL